MSLNELHVDADCQPRGTSPALSMVESVPSGDLRLRGALHHSNCQRPMSHQLVIDLTRDAIITALMLAAPMLLIALGVGLIISIIQSVTQIQEQTLVFVPKLVLVGGAFIVGLPWLLQILIRYTQQLIRGIPTMVS